MTQLLKNFRGQLRLSLLAQLGGVAGAGGDADLLHAGYAERFWLAVGLTGWAATPGRRGLG